MTRIIRRRQLLKATLGLGGLACASPFGWSMVPKVMASTPNFTDYKAELIPSLLFLCQHIVFIFD